MFTRHSDKVIAFAAATSFFTGANLPVPASAITVPFTESSIQSALDFGRHARPDDIGVAPEWNFGPASGAPDPKLTVATAFYYVSLCEADDPRSTDTCTKLGRESAEEIDMTVTLENPRADQNTGPVFTVAQGARLTTCDRPDVSQALKNRYGLFQRTDSCAFHTSDPIDWNKSFTVTVTNVAAKGLTTLVYHVDHPEAIR